MTSIEKKYFSNTREEADLGKGGQPEHEQHTLPTVQDDEITETQEHTLEVSPPVTVN